MAFTISSGFVVKSLVVKSLVVESAGYRVNSSVCDQASAAYSAKSKRAFALETETVVSTDAYLKTRAWFLMTSVKNTYNYTKICQAVSSRGGGQL